MPGPDIQIQIYALFLFLYVQYSAVNESFRNSIYLAVESSELLHRTSVNCKAINFSCPQSTIFRCKKEKQRKYSIPQQ